MGSMSVPKVTIVDRPRKSGGANAQRRREAIGSGPWGGRIWGAGVISHRGTPRKAAILRAALAAGDLEDVLTRMIAEDFWAECSVPAL